MPADKHLELRIIYVEEGGFGGFSSSKGYRGECDCGWESTLCGKAQEIGREFDQHVSEALLLPEFLDDSDEPFRDELES